MSSAPKESQSEECAPRQTWTRPQLTHIGQVEDVLQGGGGKLSPTAADPGDNRKPSGQG